MQIDLFTSNKIINNFREFRKLSIAMIQILWNCTNMTFTGNAQVANGINLFENIFTFRTAATVLQAQWYNFYRGYRFCTVLMNRGGYGLANILVLFRLTNRIQTAYILCKEMESDEINRP